LRRRRRSCCHGQNLMQFCRAKKKY
jgi:hypothetical protein